MCAQWSRTSGAVVNIVLKSGTNAFHGDVYDYTRNSFFSASNPFDRRNPQGGGFLSSPRVNYNDFGGTLGGPIIKNRTFFFFSWETSLLHENKNQLYTVPDKPLSTRLNSETASGEGFTTTDSGPRVAFSVPSRYQAFAPP